MLALQQGVNMRTHIALLRGGHGPGDAVTLTATSYSGHHYSVGQPRKSMLCCLGYQMAGEVGGIITE